MASAFKAKFKKIAKRDYGNVKMTLSEKDLGDFPVMDFVFSNGSGGEVSRVIGNRGLTNSFRKRG